MLHSMSTPNDDIERVLIETIAAFRRYSGSVEPDCVICHADVASQLAERAEAAGLAVVTQPGLPRHIIQVARCAP